MPLRFFHLIMNSVAFGLCYTLANWLAQQHGVVRNVALPLDQALPFLPWMILPYMLSAPLFAASFLTAADQDTLRALSRRTLLATVVAGLVFVLWPLRFSALRPAITPAMLAPLYEMLAMIDRPYNQLPSLHVAYCVIFWPALRLRVHGVARVLLGMLLVLVAVSTLFTYQHHVLDLVAGAALGLACIALLRPTSKTPAVGFHYLIGAGMAVVLLPPWSAGLAAYITASLLLVSLAQGRGKHGFLSKRDGRLPLLSWLLYAPYLFGYWLTWQAVRWRGQAPFAQIAPGLYVGRRLSADEARQLPPGCAVIDLANELSETTALRRQPYHHFPLLDMHAPPAAMLDRVAGLIDQHLANGHPVYLHCAMGYQRGPAIAAHYLARIPT